MAQAQEAELKFELTAAEFARLAAGDNVADLAVGPTETADLVSTYYDTADHRLRRAMASLRIRQTGDRFEQTVKIGGEAGAALSNRTEITVPVEGDTPDLAHIADMDIAAELAALLDGEPLQPLFTIAVRRTTRLLVTQAGDEIEYALDHGEAIAGDRRRDVIEAEFELKSGDPRALFQVAKTALRGVPARFSRLPKSERGFRLAEGEDEPAAQPARAEDVDLEPDMPVEAALQAVLRSCFAQVAANVAAVLASDDPEGPHQLRVGLRRLRSALTVFRPAIDRAGTARLETEIRDLARAVGALRDLDVLIEDIVAPCAGAMEMERLTAILRARRDAVKTALVAELQGPAASALLIDTAAYTEMRGWISPADIAQSAALSQPVGDFAEKAVRKRWIKVARRGRGLEGLSVEERHDLRKEFKKLRYALDFLGGLLPRRDRKRLIGEVKEAQEVLGYLNDVAMARSLPDIVKADPSWAKRRDKEAIERSIGFCLGWHEARAQAVWDEQKTRVALDAGEV